jgi:SAM-dependent methyltransferase
MVTGSFPRDRATPAAARPLVEWEQANCPLCGGGRWATLLEAPDLTPGGTGLWFAVVQCADCRLCFTNPRPSPATIGNFYPAGYGPHQPPARPPAPPRWWRRTRGAPAPHGGGRLLDFGCGGGAFLERMRRQGWQVTGLDTSDAAVRRARDELGLPVLAGSLPHPALAEGSFDLITMRHSLEHVHAPREVLRAARRLLAPGGKLLVAVPNLDSAAFRWCGAAWAGLDLPRHLTHFTPHTLTVMLEQAGFAPGAVRAVRHSSWLRQSARRACQHFRGTLWHRWLRAKLPSRLAAGYACLTGQADCMEVTAVKSEIGRPARAGHPKSE